MIIKAYKYKGGLSDARRLNEHLWKSSGQRPELSDIRHLYVADTLAGMRVMQSLQRGSRAQVAFWHIIVAPITTLDDTDRSRVVNLIITELKAETHPLIVLSHNEKPRARRGGGARHFHCVLGHVSPVTGLALNVRNHVQRLQKVGAIAGYDIEGQTSVSSYHHCIITHLSREGRPDVAAWLTELATKPPRLQQPRMTDAMRRSAAAAGFELAPFHAKLERLWNSGASEQAFDKLLGDAGVVVRRGDRSPVVLLYRGDLLVGVLNRILRQPHSLVYQEASVRFPGLFGKPRIVDDISASALTSRIEKLRQETTDRLDAMLRRLRTKILVLTYKPSDPKEGPDGNEIPIAEQLQKLTEGEAIFERALDLLWSNERWVLKPIDKLLGHSKYMLRSAPLSPRVSGMTDDMESHAMRSTDEPAAVFDEDEVLEYQPFGLKI
jgi:hypothetical protein